jgi:hypothetical protein
MTARRGLPLAAALIAIAGCGSARLDTRRRRWRRLAPMRTPRHGLGGVSLADRVYALEGGPQPGFHFSSAIEALPVR